MTHVLIKKKHKFHDSIVNIHRKVLNLYPTVIVLTSIDKEEEELCGVLDCCVL